MPPSLQRRNAQRFIAVDGKAPIDDQFFAVDLDPRLHQLALLRWQFAIQHGTVFNRKDSFIALIAGVNVRCMMPPVVAVV